MVHAWEAVGRDVQLRPEVSPLRQREVCSVFLHRRQRALQCEDDEHLEASRKASGVRRRGGGPMHQGLHGLIGPHLHLWHSGALWTHRQMLQDEDSENYHIMGSAERGELLFRLFKHLCLGGELNQYEDTVEPYISVTKKLYKELISVQKDPESKKIGVVSAVLKVHVYDESGQCHPGRRDEEQTFAYLMVDPYKHHVTLLSHSYGVGTMTL
ncbi:cilia- and flagella-associated protein 300 isoform X1 [Phyllopteryx taeniolatus]|uniref:cilia- and flagella-associated protein 300 isoform X1 n=1 Tax=Phyllopteryx taeniolatus TaxID=161469 RepID=UPI002AD40D20|nr:cilia- and flagella-associated protein 300 isoform X1 [Phyllopteryx taeniolatus]